MPRSCFNLGRSICQRVCYSWNELMGVITTKRDAMQKAG